MCFKISFITNSTEGATPTGAVSLIGVQSKAVVAATAETADGVPTSSVGAESVYHPALVYVCETRGQMRTGGWGDRHSGRYL